MKKTGEKRNKKKKRWQGLISVTAHNLLTHPFLKDTKRLRATSLQSAEYLRRTHGGGGGGGRACEHVRSVLTLNPRSESGGLAPKAQRHGRDLHALVFPPR